MLAVALAICLVLACAIASASVYGGVEERQRLTEENRGVQQVMGDVGGSFTAALNRTQAVYYVYDWDMNFFSLAQFSSGSTWTATGLSTLPMSHGSNRPDPITPDPPSSDDPEYEPPTDPNAPDNYEGSQSKPYVVTAPAAGSAPGVATTWDDSLRDYLNQYAGQDGQPPNSGSYYLKDNTTGNTHLVIWDEQGYVTFG